MIPEKLTHDGRCFRNNWLMMAVFPEKGSWRQRFPEKRARDGRSFRKTSLVESVSEKTDSLDVSEKLAHDGRGFRINRIMTAV
jgi:hypothetical protein